MVIGTEYEGALAVPKLPGRREQAAERRRQLILIAGQLIEEGGAEAATIPGAALRAGCARTLVYRYFASREALLMAVLESYFERLEDRISEADLREAVAALVEPGAAQDPDAARPLIALCWDALSAAGLGGAILRSAPLLTPRLSEAVDVSRRVFERRFTEPLQQAGLSSIEAETAVDAMIAGFVRLALRARNGELSREEGIDLHARATIGLIGGLLRGRVRATPPTPTDTR